MKNSLGGFAIILSLAPQALQTNKNPVTTIQLDENNQLSLIRFYANYLVSHMAAHISWQYMIIVRGNIG